MRQFAPLAALLLAACSATPPPPTPQKSVIDTQMKALEKAKGVEATVEQSKQDADRKIDDAGG